jgi:hypothetical protein
LNLNIGGHRSKEMTSVERLLAKPVSAGSSCGALDDVG